MRYKCHGSILAGVAALLLAACSSGGSDDPQVPPPIPPPASNVSPTANAGTAQSVTSGATVTLNGSLSSDPDGSIASYAWTQTAGTPTVALANPTTAQPTFPAPAVTTATALTFSLTVTDNLGAASAPATVTITVNPPAAGMVTVTGTIRYERVPFNQNTSLGLNYAAQSMMPARGIVVRALSGTTQTVLASGVTSDTGGYSLSVAVGTSIRIQAVAQMAREAPLALPRWNFRVMDNEAAIPTPYTFADATPFDSSTAGAHDLAIPSGYSNSGNVTGARASAPFAVLDTVFRAMQTVLAVAQTTNFPPLILDWAADNPGSETFYDSTIEAIVLSADPTEDTDEFDQHVIAHEFGHYVENSFSRADNIGGAHGRGDKLDIRVAFGEGFGYAFSAIVLGDPVTRDSFVNGGVQVSSTFNVETNPQTNQMGAPLDDYGCFCSESSVWSILWDIYDPAADANDTLSLGFLPMWTVLTNEQRTTPAFTSIFSFISALKAARPGDAAAINTLLFAQNIDSVTDAFATGESNFPTNVPSGAVLPLYSTGTVGGPAMTLLNVDNAGLYNTLGNHRFIRFNVTSTRNVTISASSSNPDPNTSDTDFIVFRNGVIVAAGINAATENPEVETFSATSGTYIIDVYDCANGCPEVEGTRGDYILNVTIN